MRAVLLCGAALITAWWNPSRASAHAVAIEVDPPDGAVVEMPPEWVTITFNEPVNLPGDSVRLLDPRGQRLEALVTIEGSRLVVAPATVLGLGTHVITWKVVSVDGHLVAAASRFSIGTESASSPLGSGHHHPENDSTGTDPWRALGHLGVLAAGTALYPATKRRWIAAGGATLAVASGVARVADDVNELGWSSAISVGDTRHAILVTMAGAALGVTAAARRLDTRVLWKVSAGVLAVGAWTATGLMSGHALGLDQPWNWILHPAHLAASLLWAGGVVAALIDPSVLDRVTRVVLVAVPTMLFAGITQAWALGYRGGGDAWSGRLTLKLLLLATALAAGLLVRRRLRVGSAPHGRTVRTLLGVEVTCLVAVAAVSASLAAVAPPAHANTTDPPQPRATTLLFADGSAELILDLPEWSGESHMARLELRVGGRTITNVHTLRITISSQTHGVPRLPMAEVASLPATVVWRWPAPGLWLVEAELRLDRFTVVKAHREVNVREID